MNNFGDEELTSILLGSIPEHHHLCYLMGTIAFSGNQTANASNKAYQNQIFKCRCLIFSEPEVIASPVLGAVLNIHIIISREFHSSGKLKRHLDKLSITVPEPVPLTNAIYEACLRYTILAKLAPSWNQIDRYLVHGRNFLLSSAPLDATKLEIVINEQDMHIVLSPLRMRLPQVCLQDLHLTSFHPHSCVNLSSHNLVINVLPSLNQANVLMVTAFIPQNSLFKTYKELKRHWKNSYGYRLPESDEGMIYVTVKFGNWFSESLTYPLLCVRAGRPVFLRQRQPQVVLLQLVADLRAKVPYICGFPFGIETTIKYALPKLNILAQTLFPCNLTAQKPDLKRLFAENSEEKEDQDLSQLVSPYTQTQTQNKRPKQ